MPSPYQTNCYDYTKLGFKSTSDCINKCNIELALKQCNVLPYQSIVDEHNDKDNYPRNDNERHCLEHLNYSVCYKKYNSLNCINEDYSSKIFQNTPLNNSNNSTLSIVEIYFANKPDLIYNHSPAQYPIEFTGFICGATSLWTGFSVISIYKYAKRIFILKKKKSKKINLSFGKSKSAPIQKLFILNRKETGKRLLVKTNNFSGDIFIPSESPKMLPFRRVILYR